MAKLYLLQGDISAADADAIINSANNDLILGAGESSVIRRQGGAAIQEECTRIGTLPLGGAAVTGGGTLKCRWIIHAAVNPIGLWADEKSVRNGMRNSLKRAEEKKVKSLAVPAVGTADGAFPLDRCADVVLTEVSEHTRKETSIEAVVFVMPDEKLFKTFEEHMKRKFPEMPIEAPPAQLPRAYTAGAAEPAT